MKSSRDPGFVRKLTIEETQYPCYTLYKFHKLRLMHDMHCSHAGEMYSEILAARMRELKETQEGVDAMCREMDALYQEGIEFGEERGKKEMVQSLFAMGIPLEKIAQAAKESVSCVRQWIAEGTTAVK